MSSLYQSAQNQMLEGTFNWTVGTYSIMLVSSAYTPNFATDTTLSNIPSGAQLLAAPLNLSSLTVSGGYAQAANPSWTSLTTSAAVAAVVVLQNVGSPGSFLLIAYINQGTGFGQAATAAPANVIFDTRGIFQP